MTVFICLIALILFASVGLAFISRMDGGGWPVTAEVTERLLAIAPYSLLGFAIHPIAGVLNLAAYAGRATGHGQYFPDVEGKTISTDNKEFVDPLVTVFMGVDPRLGLPNDLDIIEQAIEIYTVRRLRIRCALGMALTGLLVTWLPALTALYFGHAFIALLLILSGFGKAAAYLISHHVLKKGTEFGELLNGFQQGIFVFSSIAIVLSSYIMNSP